MSHRTRANALPSHSTMIGLPRAAFVELVHSLQMYCSYSSSSGKRACDSSESKWSSPHMDNCNPIGVTTALPASWVEIGYLVVGKNKWSEEFQSTLDSDPQVSTWSLEGVSTLER
ncbi:hypothetical protein EVAR_59914_1 [Eumeta japonica]|uniref:Uncharacterized protein n=1 Tax=Eumeta variegata TaxID=151549 RepID=A0A4C1YSF3_EUMVA|nr:hypothetical protein EVAR_59914_1 [Eumeta japonica]